VANAVLHDVDAGVKELLEGIAEWNSTGLVVTTGLGYSMVTHAYFQAGRWEETLKYAQIGIEHIASCEEKHFLSEILRYKAEVLAMDNSTADEAESLFKESIEVAKEQGSIALIERANNSYASYLQRIEKGQDAEKILNA